jgi:hypothetical protein
MSATAVSTRGVRALAALAAGLCAAPVLMGAPASAQGERTSYFVTYGIDLAGELPVLTIDYGIDGDPAIVEAIIAGVWEEGRLQNRFDGALAAAGVGGSVAVSDVYVGTDGYRSILIDFPPMPPEDLSAVVLADDELVELRSFDLRSAPGGYTFAGELTSIQAAFPDASETFDGFTEVLFYGASDVDGDGEAVADDAYGWQGDLSAPTPMAAGFAVASAALPAGGADAEPAAETASSDAAAVSLDFRYVITYDDEEELHLLAQVRVDGPPAAVEEVLATALDEGLVEAEAQESMRIAGAQGEPDVVTNPATTATPARVDVQFPPMTAEQLTRLLADDPEIVALESFSVEQDDEGIDVRATLAPLSEAYPDDGSGITATAALIVLDNREEQALEIEGADDPSLGEWVAAADEPVQVEATFVIAGDEAASAAVDDREEEGARGADDEDDAQPVASTSAGDDGVPLWVLGAVGALVLGVVAVVLALVLGRRGRRGPPPTQPPGGYPEQGHPQQGWPQQGHPQQGWPPQPAPPVGVGGPPPPTW